MSVVIMQKVSTECVILSQSGTRTLYWYSLVSWPKRRVRFAFARRTLELSSVLLDWTLSSSHNHLFLDLEGLIPRGAEFFCLGTEAVKAITIEDFLDLDPHELGGLRPHSL